jgi:hypothetical protein
MVKEECLMTVDYVCLFCFRGYYKCTTMKECPARKKVERAKDDPKMMIVTYEEEHCHEIDTENISRSGGFSGI